MTKFCLQYGAAAPDDGRSCRACEAVVVANKEELMSLLRAKPKRKTRNNALILLVLGISAVALVAGLKFPHGSPASVTTTTRGGQNPSGQIGAATAAGAAGWKASCSTLTVDQAEHPLAHTGERVTFRGEVVAIGEDGPFTNIHVVRIEGQESHKQVVVQDSPGDPDIVIGAKVRFWGTITTPDTGDASGKVPQVILEDHAVGG
jgi:hypothetical protein